MNIPVPQHSILILALLLFMTNTFAQTKRSRDFGIEIGILKPGKYNAITDVKGVMVGHHTLIKGDSIRTGVTAILPHAGNFFQKKIPTAIFIGNGFGKLAGYSQVKELGNIETPIIVVMTDAPLDARNLERIAKRAIMGIAKTGGIASNGSGDYVIAASTAEENFIPYSAKEPVKTNILLRNDEMSPLFLATIEATEEAIINSLFAAQTMTGRDGHTVKALPLKQVMKIMKKYNKF